MNFKIISSSYYASDANTTYLIANNWDDWFKYRTTFFVVYVDEKQNKNELGYIKIGHKGMEKSSPDIPNSFENLNETFFSVGQDESYYQTLNNLGDTIRDNILISLNDIAKNEKIYKIAIEEDVTNTSLLRDISYETVTGQFRRMAQGGARLTQYRFSYLTPDETSELSFEVEPESNPPTNIHVLIGRNGVGKTYLLTNMVKTLLSLSTEEEKTGKFRFNLSDSSPVDGTFAGLVFVSFSAFDNSELNAQITESKILLKYSYVGLKRPSDSKLNPSIPKSPEELGEEFANSASQCRIGAKKGRWKSALSMLDSDPVFKDIEIIEIDKASTNEEFRRIAIEKFSKLSSGHKIVLLTITRLVETVEEKTIVLLDEPESHLHPPLLAAFIRVLSDLLIQRNGVALIATHSPVVLQEVPKKCVWMIRNVGQKIIPERLDIESFGESIGILTHKIFGLEVTQSGFHKLLLDAAKEKGNFEEIVALFRNELGMEAKAIIRNLIANIPPSNI